MAKSSSSNQTVVVSGDVTADWNIARLKRGKDTGQSWNASDMVRVCFQAGGAALLGDVIEALVRKIETDSKDAYEVKSIKLAEDQTNTRDPRCHHSYAMWAPYPKEKAGTKQEVWRIKEFLGIDTAQYEGPKMDHLTVPDDPKKASIVVIDDAALGFRDQKELWPQAVLNPKNCDWIVTKMASPVAQGPLWEYLMENCAERTIALMTVNDLRRTEAHISRVLSWERTAQDLYWELLHNPQVNGLSRCAHVVITLGMSGVLLLSQTSKQNMPIEWECKLYFDPRHSENAWERDYPGSMVGYTTCLTASIVGQLLVNIKSPDVGQAIQSGVQAMRTLHIEGYGTQTPGQPVNQPQFPMAQVVGALSSSSKPLSMAVVQDPVRFLQNSQADRDNAPGFWTVLDDVSSREGVDGSWSLAQRAGIIVEEGIDLGLKDLPLGQYGALTTADRHEIEGFSSIQSLIAEYCVRPKSKPLSIAVFGPPGAGKSFGVKQVAKSIGQVEIQDCTFNLSQFTDSKDLIDALHQVRDISLSGKMPLVFWDEFDTTFGGQKTGWLRYFLAPMQDGQFQDGQITHHIGQAIFVFAGGTCATFEEFNKHYDEDAIQRMGEEQKAKARLIAGEFKDVKGPDFVSRLSGFINILGPNPTGDAILGGDKYYLIRRAIVLRNLMQNSAPYLFSSSNGKGRLNIDSGVLHAFLHVSRYKHGVRSIETIINMSSLSGCPSFERSSLPPEAQLNLHVNGLEFLSLVQQPNLSDGDLLERLARANHQVYCVGQKGQKDAPPEAYLTYDELSPDLKKQNMQSVRDIPNKLSTIGHIMISARSDDPPFDFPGPYLEILSEMEHERYLAAKVEAGWKYGDEKDPIKKENPSLRPWRKLSEQELSKLDPKIAAAIQNEDLPEYEKDKDRDLVMGIPKLLALAGYTIIDLKRR